MERSSLPRVLREWATLGITVAPLLLIGFLLGNLDLKIFFSEFGQFLSGGMETIKPESVELSNISNLIIVGVIAVVIWEVVDDIIAVTAGKPKLNEAMTKFQNMPLIALLVVFAITVIAEEVVFRGLFLWAMPKVFQGDTALYILVILSSFLFATLHIFNYKKAGGYLYLTKIIPFFVEALLLAFVFLKFGLFGAFLVHYVHNFVSTFNSRIHFEKTSGLTV